MKFSIAVNMNRFAESTSMRDVIANTLALVKMADQGGFETVWASEHHCIEMNIAPNPFVQLTYWAQHTTRIRLGTAVICAPYWHPIRAAEECALADLYSDGRLELGLARGAFQYEFDRMANGISQKLHGGEYLYELLPVLKQLWAGDYEHNGKIWRFPKATAVPKPLQKPHPPLWVAARGEKTFNWAIENDLGILSTPLQKPFEEVLDLASKLETSLQKHPEAKRPRWLVMRNSCVYDKPRQWRIPVESARNFAAQFQGLFTTEGEVINGFPTKTDLVDSARASDYTDEGIWKNMMFGTPDEIIEKLEMYQQAGVDLFCYGADFGLDGKFAQRSLELFITRIMPHFQQSS